MEFIKSFFGFRSSKSNLKPKDVQHSIIEGSFEQIMVNGSDIITENIKKKPKVIKIFVDGDLKEFDATKKMEISITTSLVKSMQIYNGQVTVNGDIINLATVAGTINIDGDVDNAATTFGKIEVKNVVDQLEIGKSSNKKRKR
jgi:hypothetical protein